MTDKRTADDLVFERKVAVAVLKYLAVVAVILFFHGGQRHGERGPAP